MLVSFTRRAALLGVGLLAIAAAVLGVAKARQPELPDGLYATFHTSRGDITAELFYQRVPMTVLSFVGLAEGVLTETPGRRYFDDLTFHRVVPGFVVQGGDPLGTGEGGPGYAFPDEFVPGLRHDAVGVLSMANAGPDTNGSQFFFTLAPVNRLNYLHSVFGRVVSGLELLPQIAPGDTFTVTVERRGKAAKDFAVTREAFERYLATAKRAVAPHFADPENVLPLDPPRARGLDNKLANFERFTGHRLYGRLFPTLDPADRSAPPANVARRLADEAGVAERGVLVAHWVAENRWAIAWPAGWESRFKPEGVSADAPLAERETAFFNSARERAQTVIARAEASGQSLTEGQRVKAMWDEVLDGLIVMMESDEAGRGR